MLELDLLNMGIKTLAMLLIVLGLLVSVLYFMKKFSILKHKTTGDTVIKVIASMHLSPKEKVEVLEISGEKIVLGITPGNIRFLTKIQQPYSRSDEACRQENEHQIEN